MPKCWRSSERIWRAMSAHGSKPRARRSTAPPPHSRPEAGMADQRTDVPLADFRVQERVRVRFNEIDGQKIVFNANYLVYADIGVTEYFRAIGEGQPGPYFNQRSEEHTSELQSLMRISYAVFCLKKKKT